MWPLDWGKQKDHSKLLGTPISQRHMSRATLIYTALASAEIVTWACTKKTGLGRVSQRFRFYLWQGLGLGLEVLNIIKNEI